ncbi:hypothetical protein QQZ08_005018 [Neonectria magnoliae]|uniref:Tautomerase cis-CaaD-like domain-containing protein n=1 Tax=Neonectria magnoliae TaxID=2732573 RepID=A0ABR1I593_9HYPO
MSQEQKSVGFIQINMEKRYVLVHLGIVWLVPGKGYILPGGDRVVHMMLMSWGGETAEETAAGISAEVKRSFNAVWAEGVDYFDGRDSGDNLLWNEERRRVMLIKFDRSSIHVTR